MEGYYEVVYECTYFNWGFKTLREPKNEEKIDYGSTDGGSRSQGKMQTGKQINIGYVNNNNKIKK